MKGWSSKQQRKSSRYCPEDQTFIPTPQLANEPLEINDTPGMAIPGTEDEIKSLSTAKRR